jgi:HTH-type transcriptional regulator/antitoxin HigA
MKERINAEKELLAKPGDTLLETLEYIKMSQLELAERIGKTPSKVNDIISGKEPITVSTAFKLEKALGIDAKFWLNLETNYREKLLRISQTEELENSKDWLNILPIKELKKCGYIESKFKGSEMVEECLKFFGVANQTRWESMYGNKFAEACFRKSNKIDTSLGGLATFLRIGEIELRNQKLKSYDKDQFKKNLIGIRNLIRPHPEDFASKLKDYCTSAGVGVVYTPRLTKAPVSGVTRWIGGNPMIQLTDRYKSNDHFWFTFFHEAGHILLHGKKNIFIEDFSCENDQNKEAEANNFANKYLLSFDINKEIPEDIVITEKIIRNLARRHNTHSAIILGHLQHINRVQYSFGNELKLKVILDDEIVK